MKSRIIAVDVAKDVFEVAVANDKCRILERHRLSRKAITCSDLGATWSVASGLKQQTIRTVANLPSSLLLAGGGATGW